MRHLLLTAFIIGLITNAKAQGLDTSFKLNDLQVTDAPGFVLADKAPASIQKPIDPKTFGIDLLSLQQGGAVQVTPFWLWQHPNYDVKKYLHASPIAETFNLSIATFKEDSTSAISAGFRTQVLRLFSKKQKQIITDLDNSAASVIAVFDLPKEEDKARAAMDSITQLIDSARANSFLKVELAGAYLGASPNNAFKNLAAAKSGLWLSIAYTPGDNGFDALALVRYLWSKNNPSEDDNGNANFFDYGVGFSFNKNRFDGSFEFINRTNTSINKNYTRLAFVINYKLTDQITLVSSLGKNFTNTNNIFSLFGVKFGIGSAKVKVGL